MFKNVSLALVSTVITLAISVGMFEFFANYTYDDWRLKFEKEGDFYGAITVGSDNDVLVWEYQPNSITKAWGTTIETNNFGFRDKDWTIDRREDELRIAFVGDSVTLGLAIDADATFVRKFERGALSKSAPTRVEAMSFAVGGYSAIQVAELIRAKVIQFSPDYVIYVMCMNDFDFMYASGRLMKYFRKPESFFKKFLERVYAKFIVDQYYDYHFEKNRESVFSEILKIKTELDRQGIEFRVAVMPIFEGDDPFLNYPILDMHNEIVATLIGNDVPIIDMLEAFGKSALPASSYAIDDVHLTEAGHQIVASGLINDIFPDAGGN